MQRPINKSASTKYKDVSRQLPWPTKVLLVARAAGQCQFPGCRRYLFEHHLTATDGNFAQFAHIIAFSRRGPRGGTLSSTRAIHDITNLMLLCHDDHKNIDDNPADYPEEALKEIKADHEARIRHLIGLGPEMRTAVLQMKCRIAGQRCDIPVDDITLAVAPRYPIAKPGKIIDLNSLDDESGSFYQTAVKQIKRDVRDFLDSEDVTHARHVSVFALGPIPLLVALGNALSSTIAADLYQRHRTPERWNWNAGDAPKAFEIRELRRHRGTAEVALMLSVSGTIHPDQLPKQIGDEYTVYEIRPVKAKPSPTLLRAREDIESFKLTYHEFLARITALHPETRVIDLFPAVPAPIAVLCGRELLRKKHPSLQVWDLKHKTGQYARTIKVN